MTGAKCFVAGVAVGIALAMLVAGAGYWYANRRTTVLVARAKIEVEGGIVLPKGTRLTHHASLSEGFDTLALYVNVSRNELPAHFDSRSEPVPFLEQPYWIKK